MKQKISIYTYSKLAEPGSSNSYRTPHCKHWSTVWIFECLRDCTTSFFWKKIISCINLASQTSKLETWDSIFTSRNSKRLCFERQGLSLKLLVSSYFWGTVFSFSRVSKSVNVIHLVVSDISYSALSMPFYFCYMFCVNSKMACKRVF